MSQPAGEPSTLHELNERVEALASVVERLAQRQAASDIRPWLYDDEHPLSDEAAVDDLTALVAWLRDVWRQYPGPALPDCWWRHPWVIEELNAARHAWAGCLRRGAPPTGFAEWHRSVRPGTQKRIQDELKVCDVHETHPVKSAALCLPDMPDDVIGPWLRDRSEPSCDLA